MNREVVVRRQELECRPEERLERVAQAFQAVGWICLGFASIFAGVAAIRRLQKSNG